MASERTLLLDDLESRQGELHQILDEFRITVASSGELSRELTGTFEAIDRVAARFHADPEFTREPLRIQDVRDAAKEIGLAAERMTAVLEQSNALVASNAIDARMAALTDPADALIDRAFWRGAVLVGILIVGLGVVRVIPQRTRVVEVART